MEKIITFEIEYEIGETVYHAVADNTSGIVRDAIYKVRTGMVEYHVIFGVRPDESVWCDAIELSDSPIFK